jgi:indolepyruvate ferredoxin oxidoreductase alpha subunit
MAERSFSKEVRLLRLGAGQEFRGEGILAVTKALLESGVSYVGGYQGAPISHLMDVLADAEDILGELGVHFEASGSEATAAAMLSASINYPLRGAVTWKSTVGTNVASDALGNLASAGVTGGAMIIVGEDYGEGASIMQERTHAFAMKSQMWLLDPRPNLPSIVKLVKAGFELSEASNTPVMLMLRIRACHVYGRFIASDNLRPTYTTQDALDRPERSYDRIILPPSTYLQEQHKIRKRWPAAVEFIERNGINEFFDGARTEVGIVLQGGLYNGVLRALENLGLADAFGRSEIPLYVLNATYPLIPAQFERFAAGKKAMLVIEEGQPEFIEQTVNQFLRRAAISTHIVGKGRLPMAGEYTGAVLRDGIGQFLREWLPYALPVTTTAPAMPATGAREVPLTPLSALKSAVPARPSGLCIGCPERPLFSAIKLLQRELGPINISADIGCHSFSTLPPFNLGSSIMGYGLGAASASAFNVGHSRRPVALMGDGGFWHNGLTSGIANAVFNKHDGVTVIVDNGYSAATGGQSIPSSRGVLRNRHGSHTIEAAVRGVGIEWVRKVSTYDIRGCMAALRDALQTGFAGPKVIVAEGECQLSRQRRIAPLLRKRAEAGERVVRQRFGIDEDLCTGDHSCIRLSGCPSLTVKARDDGLRRDVIAHVDNSCVGCGVCGEVAHAATLCPSFYRADVIVNPNLRDRLVSRLRSAVIDWFQRRGAVRRLVSAIE